MIATSTVRPLNVRVLYTNECPATPETIELVEEIASSTGTRIQLEVIPVESPEQALELRFLGSPTVQVNGLDVDPAARQNTAFGFA